ncbi:hypothetical protein, partial [Rhizobium sp. 11_C7_N12_5]|uniref:hypothetical protein n=1 Tax=Rhizobium sp. 11_C7_N12_5 TaxID=3240770 RepID=UPI003F223D94
SAAFHSLVIGRNDIEPPSLGLRHDMTVALVFQAAPHAGSSAEPSQEALQKNRGENCSLKRPSSWRS